jgi:lactoylglutathione lyase
VGHVVNTVADDLGVLRPGHGSGCPGGPAGPWSRVCQRVDKLGFDSSARWSTDGDGIDAVADVAPGRNITTKEPLMKFGYTIVYVPDVAASLTFFERAFGLARRFLHESGAYGELATGETTLAFAAHELGEMNFPGGHVAADTSTKPLGIEVGFVTEDVPSAHARAVAAGATQLSAPAAKPWGQVVSYVRCPDGMLVELCTPMGG